MSASSSAAVAARLGLVPSKEAKDTKDTKNTKTTSTTPAVKPKPNASQEDQLSQALFTHDLKAFQRLAAECDISQSQPNLLSELLLDADPSRIRTRAPGDFYKRSYPRISNSFVLADAGGYLRVQNLKSIIQFLCSQGVSINHYKKSPKGSAWGVTSLHVAILAMDVDRVKFLLEMGADVNIGERECLDRSKREMPPLCLIVSEFCEIIHSKAINSKENSKENSKSIERMLYLEGQSERIERMLDLVLDYGGRQAMLTKSNGCPIEYIDKLLDDHDKELRAYPHQETRVTAELQYKIKALTQMKNRLLKSVSPTSYVAPKLK